jgi:hypothetical protein
MAQFLFGGERRKATDFRHGGPQLASRLGEASTTSGQISQIILAGNTILSFASAYTFAAAEP